MILQENPLPPAPPPQPAPFDVGEVLSRSFGILGRSFPKLLGIGFLIYLPYMLIEVLFPGFMNPHPELAEQDLERYFMGVGTGVVLGIFLGPLLTSALTYEVLERLRGRQASFGQCLSVGLGRLFPVLAVNLLMGFAMMFGFVLLIVPGVIVMVMLSVAIPVCVVERPGVFASLNRSVDLTRGYRWQVFAILIIGIMINSAFNAPLSFILATVENPDTRHAINLLMAVGVVALAAFQAVLICVVYHELRTKKEGATSEELLEIFS